MFNISLKLVAKLSVIKNMTCYGVVVKSEISKKKSASSRVFAGFIIMNVLMLALSIYMLYFSSSSLFTEQRMSRDISFWSGAFKNIILLSGVWIIIDIVFSVFFYIKNKIH